MDRTFALYCRRVLTASPGVGFKFNVVGVFLVLFTIVANLVIKRMQAKQMATQK